MQILAAGLLMVTSSAHASLVGNLDGELLAPTRDARAFVSQSVDSVPTFSTLWKRVCGVASVPALDTGLVYGRVTVPVGEPTDSSEIVQAAWSASNDTRDSSERILPTVSRVHVKPDGSYAICGVPVRQSILLRAARGSLNTPTLTLEVGQSRFVRRDLTLLNRGDRVALDAERPMRVATEVGLGAVVAGIIVDQSRHRIAGASVMIRGTVLTAETDETGEFVIEDVPPGTRRIAVAAAEWDSLYVIADIYAGDTVTFVGRMTLGAERSTRVAHDTTSSIRGIVTDADGHAVPGAEVRVTSSGRSTRTDSGGRYRLDGLADGPIHLLARLIGWKPVESATILTARSGITLNFALIDRAAALDTIRVTGSQESCQARSFVGFACRRSAGEGVFLDEVRVDSLNPRYIADLFDGVPGLRREGRNIVATTGNKCVAYLFNGHPPMRIEAMALGSLDARDVLAVEFYSSETSVPRRYKVYSGRCSLIVLWTSRE